MKINNFSIVIVLFLVSFSYSTPFSPIEAGTFYITADDLKGLSNTTVKQVQLVTKWQIFDQNLNIEVACAISSIKIDQRVGFEFNIKLADKQVNNSHPLAYKKILLVQITDKNGFNYPQLRIGYDYFIAQNLRTGNYNMTDFQQHLMHQSINQEETNPTNKQVHNQLFIFPIGFSSINLTHNVMYNYITSPYDMYTIHYMTGIHNQHKNQGWVNGVNFIYFRWILHPRYPYGYQQCSAVFETQLDDSFYFQCDKKGGLRYFYGLMGYSGSKFSGDFTASRTGFAFHVYQMDPESKYNVLAIPFKLDDKFEFIDNREHHYNYYEQKNYLVYVLIAVGIIFAGLGVFIFLKKKKIVYFDLQQQKGAEGTTSKVASSSDNIGKSSQLKQSRKLKSFDNYPEKNSDEQMKNNEIGHTAFNTQENEQNPNTNEDNFTLE